MMGKHKHRKRKPSPRRALGETSTKDRHEQLLENVVLGGDSEILDGLDRKLVGDDIESISKTKKKKVKYRKEPAWKDEDDEHVMVKVKKEDSRLRYFSVEKEKQLSGQEYETSLKTKFEKVSGEASWAKLKWEKEEEDEGVESDPEASELLRSTGNYLESSEWLPRHLIQLKKCTDANKEDPSQGKLKSVEFHPSAQVLLTAGMDHRLCIFQIDGKDNPKIQSLFTENFPIYTAHFTKDGREVVMGSRHTTFNYYDMIAGKVVTVPRIKGLEEHNMKHFVMSPCGKFIVFMGSYGKMHFISTQSKEWIDTMKMNGSVQAVTFDRDGTHMYSHGDDGVVYVWDVNRRSCIHKFRDDGCIEGTALAMSRNNQYLATGSYSGIVNIYKTETCHSSSDPKPVKAVMNLTTPCTSLLFNSATEILATASNYTENAVKLVHIPSMTVFSNFPEFNDPLRIPYCMDFSLNSGYFCIGTHKGQALLYRVKHYSNY